MCAACRVRHRAPVMVAAAFATISRAAPLPAGLPRAPPVRAASSQAAPPPVVDVRAASRLSIAAAATAALAAAGARHRNSRVAMAAEAKTKKKVKGPNKVSSTTLMKLRKKRRVGDRFGIDGEDKGEAITQDTRNWWKDADGNRIYNWPKSFAEIITQAADSTLTLLKEGHTRVEVDFPPLPLADLDWNVCDTGETRVVDSNIVHCIAFTKLLLKNQDKFAKPTGKIVKMETERDAAEDDIAALLKRKFSKPETRDPQLERAARVVFSSKVEMLRARDIHYNKWQKFRRPDLLRRGYLNEVNEEDWPGPFEDLYVYVSLQDASDLNEVRKHVRKVDAVAKKQGRTVRHVLFNLNLNKLRGDIEFYKTVAGVRPNLATPKIQFDFLASFRNAYFIRFGKYSMSVIRPPWVIDYSGATMRSYPSPWQIFMQDKDGTYRVVDISEKRPTIMAMKRKLIRAWGLARDQGIPVHDATEDDIYAEADPSNFGSMQKNLAQSAREGFGQGQWWELGFDEECSEAWRL